MLNLVRRIAFLFGKEFRTIGNQQAEISGVRLVDVWEIDLVDNSVRQRKPDAALRSGGGTDTGLRAGSPSRCDSRVAWRITHFHCIIIHVVGFANKKEEEK
jgi:hypothetical protein